MMFGRAGEPVPVFVKTVAHEWKVSTSEKWPRTEWLCRPSVVVVMLVVDDKDTNEIFDTFVQKMCEFVSTLSN